MKQKPEVTTVTLEEYLLGQFHTKFCPVFFWHNTHTNTRARTYTHTHTHTHTHLKCTFMRCLIHIGKYLYDALAVHTVYTKSKEILYHNTLLTHSLPKLNLVKTTKLA
jgi:hypothetical protein